MKCLVGLLSLCLVASLVASSLVVKKWPNKNKRHFNLAKCDKLVEFQPVRALIQSFGPKVAEIIDYVTNESNKGATHDELALFCDTFGPRMSGSKSLEAAIDYMRDKMKRDENLVVSEEVAMVPHWEMISQSCEITAPVSHKMNIATLGDSVSTKGTLEAEVYMVPDFKELDRAGSQGLLKGKIVMFNYKFTTYGESVKYRTMGAKLAAKYGAAAALIKSVTPFSIDSPHAGAASKSIPTAAITLEDAHLIERWIKRGKEVRIGLNLQTVHHEDVKSRNLVADIRGTTHPQDIVFVSGHMDSWYNTAGAMDDGGGMMVSYKALDTLSKLGLKGNRTMRAILWTSEEPGLIGAQQYFNDHKKDIDSFKVVIESDEGTFRPEGWSYKNMGDMGQCVMQEILFLAGAKVSKLELNAKFEGSDIELFTDVGVPGLSLLNENSQYFYYHHTSGDTMDLEDPITLDKITALFASTLYVLGNLDVDMRR